MNNLLLSPPIAFLLILAAALLFSSLLSKLSFKRKSPLGDIGKSYACGEDVQTNLMQPDYTQFFPFAFFFTILHVFTLIIATVPIQAGESLYLPLIYILGTAVGLIILFRR